MSHFTTHQNSKTYHNQSQPKHGIFWAQVSIKCPQAIQVIVSTISRHINISEAFNCLKETNRDGDWYSTYQQALHKVFQLPKSDQQAWIIGGKGSCWDKTVLEWSQNQITGWSQSAIRYGKI